jgi:hypothetical protein
MSRAAHASHPAHTAAVSTTHASHATAMATATPAAPSSVSKQRRREDGAGAHRHEQHRHPRSSHGFADDVPHQQQADHQIQGPAADLFHALPHVHVLLLSLSITPRRLCIPHAARFNKALEVKKPQRRGYDSGTYRRSTGSQMPVL